MTLVLSRNGFMDPEGHALVSAFPPVWNQLKVHFLSGKMGVLRNQNQRSGF